MEYNQFCPISKAASVLGERWNILILREMICGSTRFNDIHRGVSGISPSLLTRRLQELERAKLIARVPTTGLKRSEYALTEAGAALKPVIIKIGEWAMRWSRGAMSDAELDVNLLLMDIRRTIRVEAFPGQRAVIAFKFTDAQDSAHWWIRYNGNERELCQQLPADPISVTFECTARTLIEIWMGERDLEEARANRSLKIYGNTMLIDSLRQWFVLNQYAPLAKHLAAESKTL